MRAIHYWLGANGQCASIARSRSLFCKKGLQGPIAAYPRGDPCVQQITCKEDWAFSRHLLKTISFFHLHRIKIARAELNGHSRSCPHQGGGGGFHLAFSASEVFAGVAVSDWPLPYAVLIYRFPSFVIFVVQPVFQVITAELPSSFQVPVIPSPRVAFAAPPLDSVISNG